MFVGNFYEIMRSQCANVKEKWRVMRIMMIETAVCCSFQFALHTWNKEEERTHAANDKDWAQSKLDENMLDLDVIMSTKRTLICDDVNISLFCYVQCHRRTTEHKTSTTQQNQKHFWNRILHIFSGLCGAEIVIYMHDPLQYERSLWFFAYSWYLLDMHLKCLYYNKRW